MNISFLGEKHEKKIEYKYGDEVGFVTIKLYPLRARKEIAEARTIGLNMNFVQSYMLQRGIESLSQDVLNEIMKENPDKIITKDFDPNLYQYKTLALKYGLDPVKHSFTDNDRPIVLDDNTIGKLLDNAPDLMEVLVNEIETWQAENSLKKLSTIL